MKHLNQNCASQASMTIDVDLYRRTVTLPQADGNEVRFGVVDAGPRDALRTLVCTKVFHGIAALHRRA